MRAEPYLRPAPTLVVRGDGIDFAEPKIERTKDRAAEEPDGDVLAEIALQYDVRRMTPREMVDLSLDLYLAGYLTRDQHADLAFQSELMPNFDRTIGALTGERADPDRPRDYTEVWRRRLSFEAEHATDDLRIVERTQRILMLLEDLERARRGRPTRHVARDETAVELPPSLLRMAEKV